MLMENNIRIRLSIFLFCHYFIWGGWYVTTGTFLIKELAFSGTQIGLIYSASALAATITPFFSGILADGFIPLQRLLGLFYFLGGVLLLVASFTTQFHHMYPLILVYMLLFMPTFALSTSFTFHHVVDRIRDFSRIRVWGTIGWVAAGIIVSLMVWESTVFPMRMSAICSLLLAGYCLTLPPVPAHRRGTGQKFSLAFKELLGLFKSWAFLVFVVCEVLIRIPTGFYYSFVNPFLHEIGISNSSAKMSMGQITEILFMVLFPFFFSRLGLKTALIIGLGAWGARYYLFAMGDAGTWQWMLYIGILLHGVCYNFSSHAGQIYVDQTVPVHLKSTAQGFMTLITMGFGAMTGSLIAGGVVDLNTLPDGNHQWLFIWLVPAVVGTVVTISFALLFPKTK